MEFQFNQSTIQTIVDFYLALKNQDDPRIPPGAVRELRKSMTRALLNGLQIYLESLEKVKT